MAVLPTLRHDLIGVFAVIFGAALLVAVAGIMLVLPRVGPAAAVAYVIILVVADLAVFLWFGSRVLQRRLSDPLDAVIAGVERISQGAFDQPLPEPQTREMQRLSAAVAEMARRLLHDQQMLADNIRSLDETNRLLTDARDAMIRAEKMASVGRLGAGIAHEVGNPLGAILGYLGLLARKQDDSQRQLVLAAEGEAQRIDRIVRGLLDFARPREAVAQPLDVIAVIGNTIDLVRTQGHFSRIELVHDAPDDVPLVIRGDPFQLQQVLVNLLVNAADAVEHTPGPCVSISALKRAARSAPAHTPARRKGDPEGVDYSHRRRLATLPRWPVGDPETESGEVVEILVVDNGPGLPPNAIDQVFEPFVTTKEPGKGTGLGLAICARLVEGMGGVIHAGNADHGGAQFRVVLPAMTVEVTST
jgi:two-component system, NtrC family, sensor kinase